MSESDSAASELLEAVSMLRRQVRSSTKHPCPGSELSSAEVEIVRWVRRNPSVRVSDAAQSLGLASNTVSTLVRRLERAGWLVAGRDHADRRVVRLMLTTPARQRVEVWRDERIDVVAAALSSLPDDQRTAIERALPALQSLISALRNEEAQ